MPGQGIDFTIERLGECRVPSPMRRIRFTGDDERIMYNARFDEIRQYIDGGKEPPLLELAGPREKIFFDPAQTVCGIVTCGGLCPGINDVIRAIVLSLFYFEAEGAKNGMTGRTNMVVGLWNHQITHVPIRLATSKRKRIDTEGWL